MDGYEITHSNGIKFVYAIQVHVFFVKPKVIWFLSAGLFHVIVCEVITIAISINSKIACYWFWQMCMYT